MNEFEFQKVESSAITVKPEGVTLPDRPAKFVKLSNWNTEDTGAFQPKTSVGLVIEEAQLEIYYGFGGAYSHQLFPSKETEMLPVKNLSDLNLRCRDGQEFTIFYTYWF